MNEQDMKIQAKAVSAVMGPILKKAAAEAAEQLDFIQDLQDRVTELERQLGVLLSALDGMG